MDNLFQISAPGILALIRFVIGIIVIGLGYSRHYALSAFGLFTCIWIDVGLCKIAAKNKWLKNGFDIQLEGFADFLCFVIAPSIFTLNFTDSPFIWPCLSAFLVAGMWRIARFNVEGLKTGYYEGLPVTYNGYIFPLLALLTYYSGLSAIIFFAPGLLILSVLMVSKIKIPEL